MWGAASILLWCSAVRRPQAWRARCSGTLLWARPAAATPTGAGGWGSWGAQCAGPAASPPPPRRGPFRGRGGVPSAPGGRRAAPVAPKLGGGDGGWVGLGQGLIRTSGTTDIALPCASQLVRRVHGCPVSRPTGLMTAPVPRGGTRGREMPPCLCVWGSVSPGAPGPGGEAGGA